MTIKFIRQQIPGKFMGVAATSNIVLRVTKGDSFYGGGISVPPPVVVLVHMMCGALNYYVTGGEK